MAKKKDARSDLLNISVTGEQGPVSFRHDSCSGFRHYGGFVEEESQEKILEGVFSFDVSLVELNELNDRATRLIGQAPSGHCVQLQFQQGQAHRWFYSENNVNGWFFSETISSCLTGWVTFPLAVWASAVEVFTHCATINVTVDTQKREIRITDNTYVITAYLPEQLAPVDPYWQDTGQCITVSSADLARIGRVLMTTPISLEDSPVTDASVPFAQLAWKDGALVASRDWKHFDGGLFSVSVPASGEWNRTVEIFPFPIATEFYAADIAGDEPVTLTLLGHYPNYLTVGTTQWGFFVELVAEKIHQYRTRILAEISAAELDCETEFTSGDTHIVNVFVDEDLVSIHVITNEDLGIDYLRAEVVACHNIPRTEFIAQEINSWNSSLEGIKFIQQGDTIVARYECAAQHISDLIAQLALLQETAKGFGLTREVFI